MEACSFIRKYVFFRLIPMKYIICFLFFIGLLGCKKEITPIGNKGNYQPSFQSVPPKILRVHTTISYDSLTHFLGIKPNALIFESDAQSSIGFPLRVQMNGPVKISYLDATHVGIFFPAKFEAIPSLAGIQAGMVRGELGITVRIGMKWNAVQDKTIEKPVLSYRWSTEPSIRVLGMQIGVTSVLDQVLANKKNDIEVQIQSLMTQFFSTTRLAPMIDQALQSVRSKQAIISANHVVWDVRDMRFSPSGVQADLIAKTVLAVHLGFPQAAFSMSTQDLPAGNDALVIDTRLSYPFLSNMLANQLKIKTDQVHLKAESTGVSCTLTGLRGETSVVRLQVTPTLHPSDGLGFYVNQCEVSGVSSLLTKQVEKRIRQEVSLMHIKSNTLVDLGSFTFIKQPNLQFSSIMWTDLGFQLIGSIRGDWHLIK